jgi:hypothetical protein
MQLCVKGEGRRGAVVLLVKELSRARKRRGAGGWGDSTGLRTEKRSMAHANVITGHR